LSSARDREDTDPEKLLERLKQTGRDAALRHDLRLRKAADFLVEHARPIEIEKAKAREKLWTPGKEREADASQLWTPEEKPSRDE
jgi:hypothetical protein